MKNQPITVYGISNCDTVKKARAWLAAQGVEYEFHDFKKLGVPDAQLDSWLKQLGWEQIVNRKGTTWRALDASTQAGVVNDASAKTVILLNLSVVKRPVVEWVGGQVTVGFDVGEWRGLLPLVTPHPLAPFPDISALAQQSRPNESEDSFVADWRARNERF